MQVSEISFGCVELGIPYGIGVRSRRDMLSEKQAVELLHEAVAQGINLFDTAPAYGASEEILGKAFEHRRDDVLICTKCPALTDESGAVLQGRALRKTVEQSLMKSLTALRSDHVDIYMLHQVSEPVLHSDEVVHLFDEFKRHGLIRAAGASTYPGGITGHVIDSGKWDVVQVAFNLMDQREAPFISQAQAQGVGVLVRSVLFKGILTDKGRDLHPELKAVENHRHVYQAFLAGNVTLADLATRYVLSKDGVSSALLGIDRKAYLESALHAARQEPLTPDVVAGCDALAFHDSRFLDLPKWDRMGWLT
jgi:aryl-alcohol dehydrogenase-like predicted oxidoreductase